MKRNNALIISPNVLVRQMLSQILRNKTNISELFIVENSENYQTLVEIGKHQPNFLFLGIESVNTKEYWLLKSIVNMYPELPVILLTPLNPQGARAALAGLKMGAIDFITIPDTSWGVVLAGNHFKKRVIPIIKALPKINMEACHGNQIFISQSSAVTTQTKSQQRGSIELVFICGCLGGVLSLYDFISSLNEITVPIIIVQHMPKIYTRELAADLDMLTSLNVREAKENSILLPGQVYVAPGGYHTILKSNGRRNIIKIHKGPREMKYRPSIDVLLRSAVSVYQNRVLGVFLSGGGKDGVNGAEKLLSAGGEILVQSRKSSRLWDLPGSVQAIGGSINEYHSHQLGEEIISRLIDRNNSAASGLVSRIYGQKKNVFSHPVFGNQKN